MNLERTPEQELIRASTRELCARELGPNARAWDEAEERPRSLVATLAEAASEADEQLAPFKARMPYAAHQRARQACIDRLLRERTGLPVVAFE